MKPIPAPSPHMHRGDTTGRIMGDVILALLPATAAGILVFGLRAAAVVLVCIAAALLGERLWRGLSGQHNTLPDRSAAVTGLLLALTLPVSVPYWVAAIGALFAVMVVKGMCGGLGQNPFNPALAARAFLVLVFPAPLTRYPDIQVNVPLIRGADLITSATPLHKMQIPALPSASLWDMFLGRIGGSIGETSALALLAGGIFLVFRRVISPRIPVSYLGSAALASLVFSQGEPPILWMLYSLLGGGMFLGAMFMATDYSSSPVTPKGQILFGAGCGLLTIFFRYKGIFPEGVTYAILLMNAAVWLIEEKTAPRRFGTGR